MAKEVSAGVIVYFREENNVKYLTLHYEEGHWDFAKGHIEEGESLVETALRETKEETGLKVKLKEDFKKSLSYFYRRDEVLVNKTVYFFLGETETKEVTLSHEHIGYAWLSYEKALEKLTFDNAKSMLKKAHKYLTQKTLRDY